MTLACGATATAAEAEVVPYVRARAPLYQSRSSLDARDAPGFPITEATNALLFGFEIESLLAGVDLDNADVGNDGVIRVEPGSNGDLLDVFEANRLSRRRRRPSR